jgi:hypothetical protein
VVRAQTTAQGSETSATTPAPRRPWPLIIAFVALGMSLVGLAVSIVQTHLARQDAQEARKTSTYVVESLARKVFLEDDFDSVTLSNLGTRSIRDVTLYETDDRGVPVSVYEFEHSMPGCWSYRWEGPVRVHLAVTFRVVDEGLWLLSDLNGLRRLDSEPIANREPKSWNLASSPIRLCA